jgi:hypothetical protein
MMQKDGDIQDAPHPGSGSTDNSMRSFSHPTDITEDIMKAALDQVRGPEDGDFSRDGSAESSSLGKRKPEREPESPGQSDVLEPEPATTPYAKKERTYYDSMDHDSPASYPTHVMVPTSDGHGGHSMHHESKKAKADLSPEHIQPAPLLTPDSLTKHRQPSFEGPPIYSRQHDYSDVYRAPSYHEPDNRSPYRMDPPRGDVADMSAARPRRWACDYCNVATFLSYEEACAHEQVCARQHGVHMQEQQPMRQHHQTSYGPPHGIPPPMVQQHQGQQHGSGLASLWRAGQEVVTPPTPQRHPPGNRWGGSRGPPLPVLPHEQGYYRQSHYDQREDPSYYQQCHETYYAPPPPPPSQYQGGYSYPPQASYYSSQPMAQQPYQKRMLLAMPTDSDSLSDRQCYVRGEMCEIFAATDKDVAARHSKGAQKLVIGQVGIRCVHCSHLRPRDRAERAVCYPSSISRIYQTVADMQRFHFEHCREIPKQVLQIYRNLKTTRPRGVGSPQAYWIQSAKTMGLADTDNGIRFDLDMGKDQQQSSTQHTHASDMSIGTS